MSTKPWDEEWRADAAMPGYVETTNGEIRLEAFGAKTGNRVEVARFVIAAPDMARALLAILPLCGGMVMTRREAEARTVAENALRKAGVIP